MPTFADFCTSIQTLDLKFIFMRLIPLITVILAVQIRGSPSDHTERLLRMILNSSSCDVGEVERLIEAGADFNALSFTGISALIHAIRRGHIAVAELLIEKGVNPDAACDLGKTALIFAIEEGHVGIAELLTNRGANINHATRSGSTALIVAIQRGHFGFAKLLIEKGADVNQVRKAGRHPLLAATSGASPPWFVELLIANGSNVNYADKYGCTALMNAASKRSVEVVRFLLRNGANVDQTNLVGETALIQSTESGYTEIVRLLIVSGSNVNIAGDAGVTPLIHAISNDNREIVKSLILASANVDVVHSYFAPNGNHAHDRSIAPITRPLRLIENAAMNDVAFGDLDLNDISIMEGLIAFAFESKKVQKNVFDDPQIVSILRDHQWDNARIQMVQSVINELVTLECAGLSVLYIVAPFIVRASEGGMYRLEKGLQLLTYSRQPLIPSISTDKARVIGITGPLLNKMVYRASTVGLEPVAKALFNIYRKEMVAQRLLRGLMLPENVIPVIHSHCEGSLGIFEDIEAHAMAELAKAIDEM